MTAVTEGVRVVPDLLRRAAALVPDRPAVLLDGHPPLTFAELERRSDAFARALRERGTGRGDRVALAFGGADWPGYAVAYFGVLKLGAVALLTGARFDGAELDAIVTGYGAAAVVRPADVAAASGPAANAALPVEAGPEDAAEVVFTSGTTDRPRGVVATHANLTRAQTAWPTAVRANQPCAHALPIGSVAAQAVLLTCVGGQHTLLVAAEFTVAGFTAMVARHRATTVCLVPAMGHWLTRDGDAEPMPSVRGVSFSGAPLPVAAMPDLPRLFPNAAFHNFYTSTETYPARLATRFDPARPDAVGTPVGATAVRVTGPDGAPLPPGETGDVWLRLAGAPPRRLLGAGDAEGAGADAGDAGVRDGWTRTGDLGRLDADGHLILTGRTGDVVIVGGFNVSTGRVERVLAEHEAVAEAAAVGADHPVLGQIVAAFVVLRGDATVRDLRRHAADRLTRPELPAVVRIVDELPRNEAGKVVKRLLPGTAGIVAPRDRMEREIAAVWAEVLEAGLVSVEDNFFEIGGDSLAATRIAAALRDRLGVEVDTVAVLEAPTVAELAQYVTEGGMNR